MFSGNAPGSHDSCIQRVFVIRKYWSCSENGVIVRIFGIRYLLLFIVRHLPVYCRYTWHATKDITTPKLIFIRSIRSTWIYSLIVPVVSVAKVLSWININPLTFLVNEWSPYPKINPRHRDGYICTIENVKQTFVHFIHFCLLMSSTRHWSWDPRLFD